MKKLPVEIFALIIPFVLLAMFAFVLWGREAGLDIIGLASHFMPYLDGGPYFRFGFYIMFAYIFIRLFVIAFQYNFFDFQNKKGTERERYLLKDLKAFIKSAFFIVGIIAVSMAGLTVITIILYMSVDPERVSVASKYLMNLDYRLFGVYPSFWLQNFSSIGWFDFIIPVAYLQLVTWVPLCLIFLFFLNKKMFRQFVLSFFLIYLISLPFWIIWPAISPQEMYRLNTLNVPLSAEIANQVEYFKPTAYLDLHLSYFNEKWIDKSGKSFAVTTFPSMHAGWGLIVVYYLIKVWPLMAIILIPWFSANLLGTVYTFQHYAVDPLFGLVVGILAIIAGQLFLKIDSRYFKDEYKFFFLLDVANRDLKWVVKKVKFFICHISSAFRI